MMIQAEILTAWSNDGYGGKIAAVALDCPCICIDETRQPASNITPEPNIFVVRIICTADVFSQVEASGNYFILWSEEI